MSRSASIGAGFFTTMTTTMTKELRAPLTDHMELPDCAHYNDLHLQQLVDGRWSIRYYPERFRPSVPVTVGAVGGSADDAWAALDELRIRWRIHAALTKL